MTVLVTVVGSSRRADLELSDDRPVRDLLAHLGAAVGEPTPRQLRSADGGPLDNDASLADAGVLDGQHLSLVPADPSASASASTPASTSASAFESSSAGAYSPSVRPPAGAGRVLAAYLVLDTSDSMAGAALAALNTELGRLFDALRGDPRLADACRLSVVTFDADARLHIALTPVVALGASPLLTATRPATNYEASFLLVRRLIERDLDGLRVTGHDPMRPLVFFLTDGRPTRGFWPPAHVSLTDPSWPDAPDVVALGFGDAAEHVVRGIGTAGAYLPASAPGVPSAAPAGMLAVVMGFVLGAVDGVPTETALERAATGWRPLDEVRR